ncbi:MAG: hypothetical protein R3F55_09945 [Alphaproteobacteria bacterium]
MTDEASAQTDWSLHDCPVYGLFLRPPDPDRGLWRSELVLDIDHIVAWLRGDDGGFRFRVAPATLTFQDVQDLRIAVDFTGTAFAPTITEWSVDRVEKRPATGAPHPAAFAWQILLNVPAGGLIGLVATGFTIDHRAPPRLTAMQRVDPQDRPPLTLA